MVSVLKLGKNKKSLGHYKVTVNGVSMVKNEKYNDVQTGVVTNYFI